jgi:hypothetical protein
MPYRIDPKTQQKIIDMLGKGRKIEAIKLFREATAAGLKEAKEAIEDLDQSLSNRGGPHIPPGHAAKEPKAFSGCFSLFAIISISLIAIIGGLIGLSL